MSIPTPRFRIPSTTPLVSRSPMLADDQVIVVDGSQFDDDRRRIVVGRGISDETVKALGASLVEHEHIDGMRRWFTDLLSGAPDPDVEGSER